MSDDEILECPLCKHRITRFERDISILNFNCAGKISYIDGSLRGCINRISDYRLIKPISKPQDEEANKLRTEYFDKKLPKDTV